MGENRLPKQVRAGAGSVATMAVALLLLAASVAAGLHLPATQSLSGYPAAAHLISDRPPGGFAPLAQRFISKVLGLTDRGNAGGTTSATAHSGGRVSGEAPRAVSPRVSVNHPFTNDSFEGAYVVPAAPFTARTTTQSATREPGEPTACAPVGGTAWYRYTAGADERLLALTLGSDYALSLGVFTGNSVNGMKPVGCNNGPSGNAQVGIRADKGETYYFQVTGVAGGGSLVFSLNPVGRTERVSVSSSGAQSDNASYAPSLSADGRYVAFNSAASNLTPDQPPCSGGPPNASNCESAVFVRNRVTHATSLVSVSSTGEPASGSSFSASLSGTGRYVAFVSNATNLVPGVSGYQVYVRDRVTGITERVSEPASARPGGGGGSAPAISDDGRFVVFLSTASDLTELPAPQGTFGSPQHVYVRDRVTRTTALVSAALGGGYGNAGTTQARPFQGARPTISADGRYVAFQSDASNLVSDDRNNSTDVFIRDLRTGRTELVSVSDTGAQGDGGSYGGGGGGRYVSGDGRYVAFWSDATDLVRGDTNETSDFFVRDRLSATTTRVSVSSAGAQGHPPPIPRLLESTAGGVALSDDGRVVAFESALTDLADDAPAGPLQVYVHDLRDRTTTIGSVASLGAPGDDHSLLPALSGRGDLVAFGSSAGNLGANDDNRGCIAPPNTSDNCSDIFTHELVSPS